MLFIRVLLASVALGSLSISSWAQVSEVAKAAVVRVRAFHADGGSALGSAVVVGPGKLVTNAHVTHGAVRIEVEDNGRSSRATVVAHDDVRDLCLLDAPAVSAAAPLRSAALEAGQSVYAIGFPADRGFTVRSGQVVALHDLDGAQVIQVSAPFDYGASGGGLFDDEGKLVGILTFKARAGGPFHFALPIGWISPTSGPSNERSLGSSVPFWKREPASLPYFLRAVSLEATRNWVALASLAREWMAREPHNPGAQRALSKASAYLTETAPAPARADRGARGERLAASVLAGAAALMPAD